jgi:hypothetical protein
VDGKRAWLGVEQAEDSAARASGNAVGYDNVLPNTDLDYEVAAGSVKETIVLRKPPEKGRSSWRFRQIAKRGCGTFRGLCKTQDHYHVDFPNGRTIHVRWRNK